MRRRTWLFAALAAALTAVVAGAARADSTREKFEEILARVQEYVAAMTAQDTPDDELRVVRERLWGPAGNDPAADSAYWDSVFAAGGGK